MKPRKVGQDMVMRKRAPSTGVSSAAQRPVSPTRRSVRPEIVERASVPQSRPATPRYVSDEPVYNDSFNARSYQAPRTPARGGLLWVFAGASVIGLIVTVLSLITRSTVDITLAETVYPINMAATLYAEPADGQIAFKTATVTDRQTVVVPTTNRQAVSVSATGKVKLFSSSAKSVSIPAGTQLVSTAKKTFVTKNTVTISAGTTQKPGSVEVTVTAVQPGPDSNINLDDLKLPGFPAVIARTTTEITGGALGDQYVLTDTELQLAQVTLRNMLASSKPGVFLANQIPGNFTVPESLMQIGEPTFRTEQSANGVTVVAERTITGTMIEKDNFRAFLLNQIPETERAYMTLHNADQVTFAAGAASTPEATVQSSSLPVQLTGSFTARATIDESDIRSRVARQKRIDALRIVQAVPGVVSADITIWPPWIRRIPGKVSSITFKTLYQVQTNP